MKKTRGVSMIALVIMIIVILILLAMFMSSRESINKAGEAKYMQELSEVRKGVDSVRVANTKTRRNKRRKCE